VPKLTPFPHSFTPKAETYSNQPVKAINLNFVKLVRGCDPEDKIKQYLNDKNLILAHNSKSLVEPGDKHCCH
jgi:hypothetical protein